MKSFFDGRDACEHFELGTVLEVISAHRSSRQCDPPLTQQFLWFLLRARQPGYTCVSWPVRFSFPQTADL
jgi:hypothetical protein